MESMATVLQGHFWLDARETLDCVPAAHAGALRNNRCASSRIESRGQVARVVSKTGSEPVTEQYGNARGRTWPDAAASVCPAGRASSSDVLLAEPGGVRGDWRQGPQ